jgi:cytochrome P450
LETISSDGLECVVPNSGAEIAGTWVLGGTVVSVSTHVINRDESIWGPDTDSYNPNRWTEADETQR